MIRVKHYVLRRNRYGGSGATQDKVESKADLVGLRAAVDLQSDTSVFTYRADDRKAALNSLEIKSDFHFTKIFVYFSVLNQKC